MKTDLVAQLDERYKKYKLTIDREDVPPWVKRKEFEIARSVMEPLIVRDLSVLKVCTSKSIFEHRDRLILHLHDNLGLSEEMATTWIMYFVTKSRSLLDINYQIDGVKFFNDAKKIASGGSNPSASYQAMQSNVADGRPFVNLHIGSSATKQDVLWLINNRWKEEVGSQIQTTAFSGRTRSAVTLRHFVYGYLKSQGMKPREIRKKCESILDKKVLDDSTFRKPVGELACQEDILYEARQVLGQDLGREIHADDPTYLLTKSTVNNSHFTVVK